MVEMLGALVGGLFIFSKVVGLIKSFIFVKEKLTELSHRHPSDREATIYDHVFSGHNDDLRHCQISACAGLA